MKHTRKVNEENERIKRSYLQHLRLRRGRSATTTDKVADGLLRFESAIGWKSFKTITVEDAQRFRDALEQATSLKTGKALSASFRVNIQTSVRAAMHWLADQPGYRSRVSHSIAECFSPTLKDARIARARRPIPYPSIEEAAHAFRQMPDATVFERRNKALFALSMLTAARIAAAASLKIGHIDLVAGSIFQDGRDVNTKFSKTFTTWFFPVEGMYLDCLTAWIVELRTLLLFGTGDPLFPQPKMSVSSESGFQCTGLSRKPYVGEDRLRVFIKHAFTNAGLPAYSPHRFRNTLVDLGNIFCTTPAEIKAWSMNLGHDNISTTIDDYGAISPQRQGEIIRSMRKKTEK